MAVSDLQKHLPQSPRQLISWAGNVPYILTFIIFMLVTIPTALVRNAPTFMFLRFLQGFFGSPVLAIGGASITDIYDNAHKPIGLTVWSLTCFVAPAIACVLMPTIFFRNVSELMISHRPIIAGAAVVERDDTGEEFWEAVRTQLTCALWR